MGHVFGKVFVGTESTTIFISNDGGETWHKMSGYTI